MGWKINAYWGVGAIITYLGCHDLPLCKCSLALPKLNSLRLFLFDWVYI